MTHSHRAIIIVLIFLAVAGAGISAFSVQYSLSACAQDRVCDGQLAAISLAGKSISVPFAATLYFLLAGFLGLFAFTRDGIKSAYLLSALSMAGCAGFLWMAFGNIAALHSASWGLLTGAGISLLMFVGGIELLHYSKVTPASECVGGLSEGIADAE